MITSRYDEPVWGLAEVDLQERKETGENKTYFTRPDNDPVLVLLVLFLVCVVVMPQHRHAWQNFPND